MPDPDILSHCHVYSMRFPVEFRPCPCCGSENVGLDADAKWVQCFQCGLAAITICGWRESAKRWNTRADDAYSPADNALDVMELYAEDLLRTVRMYERERQACVIGVSTSPASESSFPEVPS